jgi:hypothetical protein
MTTRTLRYHKTAERPEATLTLPDDADVSSGYTFSLKIGQRGAAASLTKTTNITGGDGFVTVAWVAGELAALAVGTYVLQLTATTGGLDRVYECNFQIADVVT